MVWQTAGAGRAAESGKQVEDMDNPLTLLRERLFPTPKEEDLFPPVEQLERLPEDYLKRFELAPLTAPDQLAGRADELKDLQETYRKWEAHHRPLLLQGTAGIGISSVLQAAAAELPAPCTFLEADRKAGNREELLQALAPALGAAGAESLDALARQDFQEPRILIFEHAERLLLRQVGGFDLLRDFLLFVNATKSKIFWIVTINDYSLYFLDRALDFSDFFTVRLMQPLSEEALLSAMEARNEGLEMRFLKTEGLSWRSKRQLSRMGRAAQQQRLRELFFSELRDFAQGNPSRAIVFWRGAARGVKNDKVYLKAPHFSAPQEAELEELLVLEAVFEHSALSMEAVEAIFRHSVFNSRLIVNKLLGKAWLYASPSADGSPEYRISFWYLYELRALLNHQLNRSEI